MGLSLQQVRECWWLAREKAFSMLEKELAYRRCIGRPSDAIGLAARDAAELTLSLGKEIQRLDKAEKRRQRCQIRRRRQVESACNPGNAR